ncbi:MAG: type IX secretion system membrane protein PorP/SprF, partial [Bacteroidota bacterium]
MKKNYYTKIISAAFVVLGCSLGSVLNTLQAQDIHFSQFYHSPLNLSPALAGIYSGDIRFMANYNSQWENVPVGYRTFSGAAEKKFYYEGLKSSYFAVGLLLNNDQAGDLNLGRTSVGVVASYSRQLTSILFATVGGNIGATQRSFQTEGLSVDEDWDGQMQVPNSASENFGNTSVINADFAVGLNIRLQPVGADRLKKRSK